MSLAINWFGAKVGEDPMRYLDDVFRYAAVRLGQREEAEDIAIEVVQSLPNPCFRSNLRLYMLGMARRKVVDRMRRNRQGAELRDCDRTVSFDAASDDASLVGQVLSELSPDHREVLTLKYVIGLSSAEIGKLTDKKADAVDSMLQRARAAFEKNWIQLSSEEVKL